ncbi:MAG TPA: PAS domain-containing protein, partial [Chitinispirillaceae bacterium]|nr:PAS domain-containing protein [Chitinispirillaceae bacterium]
MAQVSAGAGIWDWDISTGKLTWSDELFELFGLDPLKTNPSFDIWISLLHPDDKLIAESKIKRAIVNHTALDSEYRVVLPSGERRWINALGNTIYDSSGKPIFMSGICIDITKRKIAEESLKEAHETLEEKVKERTEELEKAYYLLKESEKSLAEAQEIAHIGNWSRNIVTGDIQWSDEVYRIFGFQPQQFGVTYNVFLSHVYPEDRDFVITAAKEVLNGKLFDIDYRIIRTDGAERIVNEVVKVIFDEENDQIRLKGTIQDITERKKAEEILEKIEIVRKQEIHHRIKNNLQVISSLLDLQAEKFRNREGIKDSEVLAAFRESPDRVISMALIHEELYKGGKIDTLNFSPYIKELTENLFQTYKLGNGNVSLNMDLEENIFFDMDI